VAADPVDAGGAAAISHATPLGAAWESFQAAALGHWPPALALGTMAAYAIAFGLAAARLFRWE
jgi:ABC-2 type transport system permease protein